MIVFKCDRCKKEVRAEELSNVVLTLSYPMFGIRKRISLETPMICKDCMSKIIPNSFGQEISDKEKAFKIIENLKEFING